MTRPFGMELLLDCYGCNPIVIDDLNVCSNFLDKAIHVLGVHRQSPSMVFKSPNEFPDKAGLSGVVMLIESSIVIHTLTEKSFVSIDYYTCSIMTEWTKITLVKLAKETFNAKRIDTQFLERGKDYYREEE